MTAADRGVEQPVMVDGLTLRAARESRNVTMRKVAKVAGFTHGHLSKVERGDDGREVTPAIVHAYEKALGTKIAGIVADGQPPPQPHGENAWRSGQMSDGQRRTWRRHVASAAAGSSLLRSAGRVPVPRPVTDEQLAALEQIATLLEGAGESAGAVAHALLPWARRLATGVGTSPRMYAVIARLARRAARDRYTAGQHEHARPLWLIGLSAATNADDPDLRALILADVATQHTALGYHDDAMATLRLARGDERLSEHTRATLRTAQALALAEPAGHHTDGQACQ